MLPEKQMGLSAILHKLMIAIYLKENFSVIILRGTRPH